MMSCPCGGLVQMLKGVFVMLEEVLGTSLINYITNERKKNCYEESDL